MNELTIEAKTENLHTVFDFIVPRMEEIGCDKKMIRSCKLCVEEIFLNIANYAYNPEVGNVKMTIDICGDPKPVKVIFSFADSGTPYDPLSNDDPDIDADIDERRIGGLGIFLVKTKMDDVSYEFKDGQNILRLVKNLG